MKKWFYVLILPVIIFDLGIMCAYAQSDRGTQNNYSKDTAFELKSKCNKIGKEYYEEYLIKNKILSVEKFIMLDEPEYYYSNGLGICLMSISHSYFNKDISPLSVHHMMVIDVLKNKEIIGSHYNVNEATGKIEMHKTDNMKINLEKDEYLKQKNKVFEE